MKAVIINLANRLNKKSNGSIRYVYKLYKSLDDFVTLRIVRRNIKRAVGKDVYKNVRSLKAVVFPNQLDWSGLRYRGGYVMEKIFLACNLYPHQFSPWTISNIFLNWQDLTKDAFNSEKYIKDAYKGINQRLSKDKTVFINFKCQDISKKNIGHVHDQIFDYPLDVDPLTFQGIAVRKSNENAAHDGIVVHCPITTVKASKKFIYSILIDNTDGGGGVLF